MFRFMRDAEPEDPMFMMDPFAIHRQHMSRMLSGGFGYSPFLSITDGNMPGTRPASRRMQTGAVSPFGMLGMSGGFMDMFGMMNDIPAAMTGEGPGPSASLVQAERLRNHPPIEPFPLQPPLPL
ncbi:myeloid leukemia factor 2 [Phyllostomus discolor]|uniref:Myeloid leukemia factor 2 n=1 Tax=Phyllostomus discolor TaxID=89673 RepID=A0A834ATM9_9CHIR|nr:myeloid leukemia factor 2 [Phyllostomus discolor]